MKRLFLLLLSQLLIVNLIAQKSIHLKENDSVITVSKLSYAKGIVSYIALGEKKPYKKLTSDKVNYIRIKNNVYGLAPLALIKVKPKLLQNDTLLQGALDACRFYTSESVMEGMFWTTFLVGGVVSLIPAIPISATMPEIGTLKIPEQSLKTNRTYITGYRVQAKKMKQRDVWSGYTSGSISLIFFGLAFAIMN